MTIKFKWIGGATWVMNIDKLKFAGDPLLCPRGTTQKYPFFETTRLDNPVYEKDDFSNIDFWLLTHNHEDHFDDKGYNKVLSSKSRIIAHSSFKTKAISTENLYYLKWGDKRILMISDYKITIEAIPAIHTSIKLLRNIIIDGNGYIVTIEKNTEKFTFYVTGDTIFHKKILQSIDNRNIDLMIAHSGAAHIGTGLLGNLIGRITFNIHDIIEIQKYITINTIIPIHWGTFTHYKENITLNDIQNYKNIIYFLPGYTIKLE